MKPFAPQSQFTIFSNFVIDEIMPTLKPTHWQVLCFIIRKTVGWQKTVDTISYSQIIKGTNISSRATISSALSHLVDQNYIALIDHKDGHINTIRLNTDYELPSTSSKNEPVPVQKMNQLDSEPVQNLNTQKKVLKERKESSSLSDDKDTPAEQPTQNHVSQAVDKPKTVRSARKPQKTGYANPDTGVKTTDIMEAYAEVMDSAEPGAVLNFGQEGKAALSLAQAGWRPSDIITCFWRMKNSDFWRSKHLPLTSVASQIGAIMGKGTINQAALSGGNGASMSRRVQVL